MEQFKSFTENPEAKGKSELDLVTEEAFWSGLPSPGSSLSAVYFPLWIKGNMMTSSLSYLLLKVWGICLFGFLFVIFPLYSFLKFYLSSGERKGLQKSSDFGSNSGIPHCWIHTAVVQPLMSKATFPLANQVFSSAHSTLKACSINQLM